MAGLVERYGRLSVGDRKRGRPPDAYGSLVRSLIGQQLSVKAARAIYGRLAELCGGVPTSTEILAADSAELRQVGLSGAKVSYLRDLAEHLGDGRLDLDRLGDRSDEDIVAALTAVKGFGEWTAQMFLIFHLERPDVLPLGDLGIRRAVERLYGLPDRPGPAELAKLAEPWRPYRTLACLYLWQSLDIQPA